MMATIGGSTAALVGEAGAANPEPGKSENANYARPFETPTRPALIPLPPGAVEPAGWLRDWCLAARDGYTGHMDEYDAEFQRAWAPNHKMTGEGLLWNKGAWPYEGGGYWFDGLARWKFALDGKDSNLVIERTAMPAKWDWPLAAPLKMQVNAVPIDWQPDPKVPRLPSLTAGKTSPSERITLIPYGCTKFRISMFPSLP